MKEKQNETEKIVMLNQSVLIDFEENPFKVIFDDKMNDLIESIKENGVLTPVIVRRIDDGNYEILSGQRRVAACRLLNIDLIPAIVKDISYDDAAILLVDSNLQREELLFRLRRLIRPHVQKVARSLKNILRLHSRFQLTQQALHQGPF